MRRFPFFRLRSREMISIEKANERMMTPKAAKYLDVSAMAMCNWRKEGIGPRYYKIGRRFLYTKKDLDAFVESCAVEPAAA